MMRPIKAKESTKTCNSHGVIIIIMMDLSLFKNENQRISL